MKEFAQGLNEFTSFNESLSIFIKMFVHLLHIDEVVFGSDVSEEISELVMVESTCLVLVIFVE